MLPRKDGARRMSASGQEQTSTRADALTASCSKAEIIGAFRKVHFVPNSDS
jgi:hypothetical protein